jgi:hypothetical protein
MSEGDVNELMSNDRSLSGADFTLWKPAVAANLNFTSSGGQPARFRFGIHLACLRQCLGLKQRCCRAQIVRSGCSRQCPLDMLCCLLVVSSMKKNIDLATFGVTIERGNKKLTE